MPTLQGKTAIVTGAARGIGKAIANRLANEGARVAILDVNLEMDEATAAETGNAFAVQCDVSEWDSVTDAFETALAKLTHLDILINNAGIVGNDIPVKDLDVSEWDRVMNINLRGTYLCSRAAVNAMLPRKSGVIVSMASISGKEGNANMAPYSVSKAGVINFTKVLAKEVMSDGIRVNCVAPALIDSPLLEGMEQERVDFLTSKIPIGRLGRPEEVAATFHFLCSDESSFTTGQCFDCSGGRAQF